MSENAQRNTENAEKSASRKVSMASQALQMGKIPPQALDMEEAVLGAILLEKNALHRVMDLLRPNMFYKESNKVIYEVTLELFQASEPIDLLTVKEALRKRDKLKDAGGAYYLAELTSRVASAANIEYHARVIAEKSILRELIRISDNVITEAYDETTDVFDLLDKAEQNLFEVSESNLRRGVMGMNELIIKALGQIEEMKGKDSSVTGIPSGFIALDNMTAGWQKTDMVIIAARPAMGKTAFVLNVARNAAKSKAPVALFSLEMAATQLVQRLICQEAELDMQKVRTGRLEDYEWQQLLKRIGNLSSAPIFIDDTPALSIMDLRSKCRRLKAEKKIEMVIIDYLQLMRGPTSKAGNREQEIAAISRSLKEIAKELDVCMIALSQLSRAVESRGGDKRPQLSDLRESGSIEQDADMVMFLYRPEYYDMETTEEGESTAGLAQVLIAKQRNGPVGDVNLHFIKQFGRFGDWEAMGSSGGDGAYGNMGGGGGNIVIPSKMNRDMPSGPPPADDFVPF